MKGIFLLLCLLPSVVFAATADTPALMLATVYDGDVAVSDYWVSEKLDGVRGHWDGHRLLTRGGHVIHAPAWFTHGWPERQLDGELWIARGQFDAASGTVRTAEPDDEAWRSMRFMVFDLPDHDGPFEARVMRMRELLDDPAIPWLRPVEQFRVTDADALDAVFREVVAGGGEGLMLHHRDARYRAGRSEHLLKYKPYDDAEAKVVAHLPGEGKYADMLGALLVERPDGTRFRIGTGFTDAERAAPPPIGSIVTYRYNGLTANGLPRFARFLRVRHDPP